MALVKLTQQQIHQWQIVKNVTNLEKQSLN